MQDCKPLLELGNLLIKIVIDESSTKANNINRQQGILTMTEEMFKRKELETTFVLPICCFLQCDNGW